MYVAQMDWELVTQDWKPKFYGFSMVTVEGESLKKMVRILIPKLFFRQKRGMFICLVDFFMI